MKLITLVAIGAVMLVLAGTSAFVAGYVAGYYLDVDTELPGMGLFAEKTINTSELYHADQFSWFTYNETENHAVIGEPSYDKHITFDFSDASYNGSLSKHYRESITYFNRSGTNLTQYVDTYWDAAGINCISSHILLLENGSVTYSADLDHKGTGTWNKFLYVLPYGYRIAPRGEEKVTIGDRTYDCMKYFLPDHREGNTIEVLQHTLWFNDSIPVPVKIHIHCDVTLELAAWG